mmetsp:Transcript_13147/g.31074  ORF Transcript_13147/g.31074 Transcript_13147/m.31074 type:complete len:91 (-) Transcript_13147:237-509(-)
MAVLVNTIRSEMAKDGRVAGSGLADCLRIEAGILHGKEYHGTTRTKGFNTFWYVNPLWESTQQLLKLVMHPWRLMEEGNVCSEPRRSKLL